MTKRAAAVLVPVLVVLSAGAPAGAGTVLSQISDPQHGCTGFVDVLSARLEQDGGLLTLSMELREPPPASVPDNEHITYIWLIDADNNAATGQPHPYLGSEFNVRVVISPLYGGGFVDVTGSMPGGGIGTILIDGTHVEITIGLSQIGNPDTLTWSCAAFHAVDNWVVSHNPDTPAATADPAPYTAPRRVTVTTPLLMLSPNDHPTGQLAVEIRDAAGVVQPTDDYHLTFHSTNPVVATVDQAGVVTAHTVPLQFGDTPVIEVFADGVRADNVAIIRVTTTDLGVTHQAYEGSNVAFYLPTEIESVDLDALTMDFQVVGVTDAAYRAQQELMGVEPFNGGRHYFVLDVSDDPVTVPCGISGNPVRLGWEFGKPVHNSCYIVNTPEHRVPQFGVIFHEMGHNFTWASWGFGQFCSACPDHDWKYSEALASMTGAWSWWQVQRCATGLNQMILDTVSEPFPNIDPAQRIELQNYMNNGSVYDDVTVGVICDILWEMYDEYGPQVWYDFFSTFYPPDEPLPVTLDTENKQATWVVAALSASTGVDQRARFAIEYGFPIHNALYPQFLAAAQARIAARPWTPPVLGDFDCDTDVDGADAFVLTGCLSGPAGTLDLPECRWGDFNGDATIDLADVADFQVAFTGK